MRQLRDVKISAIIEDWDVGLLREYGRLCGWALAKAHARSGDAAKIAGYMGASSVFDEAISEFAVEYADQNQARLPRIHQGDQGGASAGDHRNLVWPARK